MVTGEVTLLEKVGLETVAVTGSVTLAVLPVALPATLTVITIPSLASGAREVVRVQIRLPRVQIQPRSCR